MRILIIGGTRFIGAALVRRLHTAGHTVAVLNRGKSPVAPPDGVERLIGDRDDLEASAGAIRGFAPDVVVHNVVLEARHVRDLQAIVRGVADRLLMVSSVDVYQAYGRLIGIEEGPVLPTPLTEDSPLRTVLHPYRAQAENEDDMRWSYDKIPAEEAALADADLPGTVMRLPMVIGGGDYQHRLFPLWKPMVDGRPAIVMAESYAAWRDALGYVENVVDAIATAATDTRAAGRTYNVADVNLTAEALANHVGQAMGWEGTVDVRPDDQLPEALRPQFDTLQHLDVSVDRLRAELDWKPPIPLDESLSRTLAWERENFPDPLPPGFPPYEAEDRVLAG